LFLVQMFPILLALIQLFIFFRTLGSVNTYWSVIILVTVAQLPFTSGRGTRAASSCSSPLTFPTHDQQQQRREDRRRLLTAQAEAARVAE